MRNGMEGMDMEAARKAPETINVRVQGVRWENNDGFRIVRVKSGDDSFTMKGYMDRVKRGDMLSVAGEWSQHQKYGRQLNVTYSAPYVPDTKEGVAKAIEASIAGAGRKTAKLIADRFGSESFDIIESDHKRLTEIPGIGKKKAQALHDSWMRKAGIRELQKFLIPFGVSPKLVARIYRKFREKSIEKIKEDVFSITEIPGIGFMTADDLAMKMGFDMRHPHRIASGVKYALVTAAENDGHVYLERDEIMARGKELLGVDFDLDMVDGIVIDGDRVYEKSYHDAERFVAMDIADAAEREVKRLDASDERIEKIEKDLGVSYNDEQKEAIRTAAESGMMVLTGGPGVGKTTVIRGMLSLFKGMKVYMAAPTGKAAKRMQEATGFDDARTIHRLLGYNPMEGFTFDAHNQLEGDVLVVDEVSMMDILLARHLMQAVPEGMRVIFVGDPDQLPSVGAGNVLHDIISSESIPVVRLTKVYRQGAESKIITAARGINAGKWPEFESDARSDLFLIRDRGERNIAAHIASIIRDQLIPQGISPDQIQVLTPMRQNGAICSNEMNRILQPVFNPLGGELSTGLRIGDRVMQLSNDYEHDVFNGDVGTVIRETDEGKTEVEFDEGRYVMYDRTDVSDSLMLCYATTIHKSQGSQYGYVIIPMSMSNRIMLQRNLLYTAVTRAEKGVIIIGEEEAISYAIANNRIEHRNSALDERIAKRCQLLESTRGKKPA